MPNKTLSVREEDLALWERADRAARHDRTSVSALVASALADKLGHTGTCRVGVYERATPLRIEVFEGRWLTDEPNGIDYWERARDLGWTPETRYREWDTFIAETARGRIAVYARYYYSACDQPPLFEVYDDIEQAKRALTGDDRVDIESFQFAATKLTNGSQRGTEVRWRDI